MSDADIQALADQIAARFSELRSGEVTPDALTEMMELADHNDRVAAALEGRRVEATEREERERRARDEQAARLAARMGGDQTPPASAPPAEPPPAMDPAAIAAAAAQGATAALVAALGERGRGVDLEQMQARATSLSAAQRHVPPAQTPPARRASITAGVAIPGVNQGGEIDSVEAAAQALHAKARTVPVTAMGPSAANGGSPAITIKRHFDHVVDDRTKPGEIQDLLAHMLSADNKQALVAGGGWCAPSEIRYDFFNVACSDGMVDLPTVGITRGGIRFPTSPSLADASLAPFGVTFANTSNPWLWTESDDALTVTGSTNKPCVRVPCPSFNETRLECYGVCLTNGNLMDDAYPENTQNYLRLLLSAHQHAMNARIIALMVGLSSAAVTGGEFDAENPVFQQVLGGIALAATDYRARYGMCIDDVLEVVAPYWLREVIRADLRWRAGTDTTLSVTDQQISGYFRDINVRIQWVNDWQVRATGQFGHSTAMSAWPTNATVMIYAAGTFLLGNGLNLDLGVVRDSVLNAENDYTAAWSEECHLVARVGHESRQYNIDFNVNGATSALVALGENL